MLVLILCRQDRIYDEDHLTWMLTGLLILKILQMLMVYIVPLRILHEVLGQNIRINMEDIFLPVHPQIRIMHMV